MRLYQSQFEALLKGVAEQMYSQKRMSQGYKTESLCNAFELVKVTTSAKEKQLVPDVLFLEYTSSEECN